LLLPPKWLSKIWSISENSAEGPSWLPYHGGILPYKR
jgi:hypothetical protein